MNSFVVDYIIRQKLSNNHLSDYVMSQVPFPEPETVSEPTGWSEEASFREWLGSRATALSATTWHIAEALGVDSPIVWDDQSRDLWRAEIEAAVFHLYGLDRDDVETVLDSFTVLAKSEQRSPEKGGRGEFRTKRLVLERYDAMTKATETGSGYECPLDVPPAHDRIRHA
jgi:hypothetical protein